MASRNFFAAFLGEKRLHEKGRPLRTDLASALPQADHRNDPGPGLPDSAPGFRACATPERFNAPSSAMPQKRGRVALGAHVGLLQEFT